MLKGPKIGIKNTDMEYVSWKFEMLNFKMALVVKHYIVLFAFLLIL